jgi:cytochrome c oxidase subunit 2
MSPPSRGRAHTSRRAAAIAGAVALSFVLSGCTMPNFGAYKSETKTGQSTFHLWQWFSVGAIVIGGFTLLLIIWAALRYRVRRADGSLPPQTQYHLPLEMTYTVVPIIIVIALFVGTVVVENQVTATPPPATTIYVYATQWGWQFTYPKQDFTVPTPGFSIIGQTTQSPVLEMPMGQDVRIVLQSIDVVHGFYIRKFNFSRYALPGVQNVFTFHAVQTGTFFGQCTQLCGLWHAYMWFRVRVVSPTDYEAFLTNELAQATVSTTFGAKIAASGLVNAGVPVKPYVGAGVK